MQFAEQKNIIDFLVATQHLRADMQRFFNHTISENLAPDGASQCRAHGNRQQNFHIPSMSQNKSKFLANHFWLRKIFRIVQISTTQDIVFDAKLPNIINSLQSVVKSATYWCGFPTRQDIVFGCQNLVYNQMFPCQVNFPTTPTTLTAVQLSLNTTIATSAA